MRRALLREGTVVSVGCPRGSNGALERAGGDVRSIVTGCHDMYAVHRKAPAGIRESTRPTGNRVILRDREDISTSYSVCDKCRLDAVPIGRDPMASPCAARHRGYRKYIG
jgi:hypothetical protein